jgi:hypothetical protein
VPAVQEITLPVSGKKATVRRPTGRDMIQAELLAGAEAGPVAIQFAILSRVATLDGRVLPYEDFQDLAAEDIMAMAKVDFTDPKPPGPPDAPPRESSPSQG